MEAESQVCVREGEGGTGINEGSVGCFLGGRWPRPQDSPFMTSKWALKTCGHWWERAMRAPRCSSR